MPQQRRAEPYHSLAFIEIQNPEAVRDRDKVRTARAHAVTAALAKKRLKAQQDGSNFRVETFQAVQISPARKRGPQVLAAPSPSGPIGVSSIDPFETLPVNARRLTTLLHLKSSLRAGEPVFNISDAIQYQTLQSTFESGLSDGALTAALTLTLSYAASGWRMNHECIEFSSIAMQQIRQRMSDPGAAVSSPTIGAILLLLGNAYRLGELQSAQAHLQGLQMLLTLCSQRCIKLPVNLKRAIYWQDLFSSVFLGTDRIVAYDTFYPVHKLTPTCLYLNPQPPSGFVKSAHILGPKFMEVTAHVASLYTARKRVLAAENLVEYVKEIDDIQAQLEGRIHNLRQATTSDMLLCCIIAMQLCAYGFWVGVWNAALIPRELSTKLLFHLRLCQERDFDDENLLLWSVYVCKAFAIDESVRKGLDEVWREQHGNTKSAEYPPWEEAKSTLSAYIWSDVMYSDETGWFWERIKE